MSEPDQCPAVRSGSRCHKLRDHGDEHHNAVTTLRWRDPSPLNLAARADLRLAANSLRHAALDDASPDELLAELEKATAAIKRAVTAVRLSLETTT